MGVAFKTLESIFLKHDDHTSAIDMKVGGKIRKKQEKEKNLSTQSTHCEVYTLHRISTDAQNNEYSW